MKHLTVAITSTLCISLALGCNPKECTKVEPNIAEKVSPVNAALATTMELRPTPAPAVSVGPEASEVRNLLPPNPVTVGASLGRGFQGEIVADVFMPNKSQPASLRYMASGDRMRMRLDGSASDFDLVADGESLAVLDHTNHSFRKFDLSELSTKPTGKDDNVDRKNDLKRTENEAAVTFQAGLRCEEHTITGPKTEIHACVASLPGAFERGVFERATGVSVPAWLALLVDEHEIPLRVRGHYGDSGELTATVTRYSPDPLPEATFIIPSNYVQADK